MYVCGGICFFRAGKGQFSSVSQIHLEAKRPGPVYKLLPEQGCSQRGVWALLRPQAGESQPTVCSGQLLTSAMSWWANDPDGASVTALGLGFHHLLHFFQPVVPSNTNLGIYLRGCGEGLPSSGRRAEVVNRMSLGAAEGFWASLWHQVSHQSCPLHPQCPRQSFLPPQRSSSPMFVGLHSMPHIFLSAPFKALVSPTSVGDL